MTIFWEEKKKLPYDPVPANISWLSQQWACCEAVMAAWKFSCNSRIITQEGRSEEEKILKGRLKKKSTFVLERVDSEILERQMIEWGEGSMTIRLGGKSFEGKTDDGVKRCTSCCPVGRSPTVLFQFHNPSHVGTYFYRLYTSQGNLCRPFLTINDANIFLKGQRWHRRVDRAHTCRQRRVNHKYRCWSERKRSKKWRLRLSAVGLPPNCSHGSACQNNSSAVKDPGCGHGAPWPVHLSLTAWRHQNLPFFSEPFLLQQNKERRTDHWAQEESVLWVLLKHHSCSEPQLKVYILIPQVMDETGGHGKLHLLCDFDSNATVKVV